MKRLLALTWLIALGAGCAVSGTESPVYISEIKGPPDATEEPCDEARLGQSRFSSLLASPSAPGIYFFLKSNTQTMGVDINSQDIVGVGQNDFIVENVIHEYTIEGFAVPADSVSVWARFSEGSSDSCMGEALIPQQTWDIIRGLPITGPTDLIVHTTLEGTLATGRRFSTNQANIPITLYP